MCGAPCCTPAATRETCGADAASSSTSFRRRPHHRSRRCAEPQGRKLGITHTIDAEIQRYRPTHSARHSSYVFASVLNTLLQVSPSLYQLSIAPPSSGCSNPCGIFVLRLPSLSLDSVNSTPLPWPSSSCNPTCTSNASELRRSSAWSSSAMKLIFSVSGRFPLITFPSDTFLKPTDWRTSS